MSAAEVSITSPPSKLTFAERFRWLGIVCNLALVIGTVAYLLTFPLSRFGLSPLEYLMRYALGAFTTAFAICWAVFVQWRRVRDAWAGLLVPGLLLAAAMWEPAIAGPTTAMNFSLEPPPHVMVYVLVYAWILGLLWCSGLRLLDRKCLATSWQRGQFSLRTVAVLTIVVAAYLAGLRDLFEDGPLGPHNLRIIPLFGRMVPRLFSSHDMFFLLLTSHTAIIGFCFCMSGYVGWSITSLLGGLLFYVGLQQPNMKLYFDIIDPAHYLPYIATILLLTAAMTLPWVLIGWRVVWTPPLWDRSWRKSPTPTGVAT